MRRIGTVLRVKDEELLTNRCQSVGCGASLAVLQRRVAMLHGFSPHEDRGIIAVTVGIVGWIEGHLTAGPGFAVTAGLLAFVIVLAIFNAMDRS
jgi:hypothetical protein